MQSKTTRAFRTISEAAEELDLQPHVLRFWESKFSQIRPIKRAGGRRFYRPEDIDLLRGIKILLHEEKHPIKNVQKIIRLKGPNQVVELGRSIQRAAKPKAVTDTVLVPERIVTKESQAKPAPIESSVAPSVVSAPITVVKPASVHVIQEPSNPVTPHVAAVVTPTAVVNPTLDVSKLEQILSRLETLREQWEGVSTKADE